MVFVSDSQPCHFNVRAAISKWTWLCSDKILFMKIEYLVNIITRNIILYLSCQLFKNIKTILNFEQSKNRWPTLFWPQAAVYWPFLAWCFQPSMFFTPLSFEHGVVKMFSDSLLIVPCICFLRALVWFELVTYKIHTWLLTRDCIYLEYLGINWLSV